MRHRVIRLGLSLAVSGITAGMIMIGIQQALNREVSVFSDGRSGLIAIIELSRWISLPALAVEYAVVYFVRESGMGASLTRTGAILVTYCAFLIATAVLWYLVACEYNAGWRAKRVIVPERASMRVIVDIFLIAVGVYIGYHARAYPLTSPSKVLLAHFFPLIYDCCYVFWAAAILIAYGGDLWHVLSRSGSA